MPWVPAASFFRLRFYVTELPNLLSKNPFQAFLRKILSSHYKAEDNMISDRKFQFSSLLSRSSHVYVNLYQPFPQPFVSK